MTAIQRWLMYTVCLLFASLLLRGEDQKAFDKTVIGVGAGLSDRGHLVPEFDLDVRMASPVLGFQPYSYTGFTIDQVTRAKGKPIQIQTTAVEGLALVHPLGEYVYYGFLAGPGVAVESATVGMAGKTGAFLGYRFGKSQHWSVAGVFVGDFSTLNKGGVVSPALFLTARLGWGK